MPQKEQKEFSDEEKTKAVHAIITHVMQSYAACRTVVESGRSCTRSYPLTHNMLGNAVEPGLKPPMIKRWHIGRINPAEFETIRSLLNTFRERKNSYALKTGSTEIPKFETIQEMIRWGVELINNPAREASSAGKTYSY
jgi:hypothetical protein